VIGSAIQYYQRGSPENKLATLACVAVHGLEVANGLVSYAQGYVTSETLLGVVVADGVACALSWWAFVS